MSTNYMQYCILGASIDLDDIKVIDSDAIIEEQSRYNPKTGKETHKEKVLVKEEVFHYEFMGFSHKYLEDLLNKIRNHYNLYFHYDDDRVYLGIRIGNSIDYGRVKLIEDEVDVDFLVDEKKKLEVILPNYEIQLYFINYIG